MEDLDFEDVRGRLVSEILSGFLVYLHFGITCSSWANANTLSGGTRRIWCPEGGDPPLEREVHGNKQAEYVCFLAALLASVGGWFTIENPTPSLFWKSCWFIALCEKFQFGESTLICAPMDFVFQAPRSTHIVKSLHRWRATSPVLKSSGEFVRECAPLTNMNMPGVRGGSMVNIYIWPNALVSTHMPFAVPWRP